MVIRCNSISLHRTSSLRHVAFETRQAFWFLKWFLKSGAHVERLNSLSRQEASCGPPLSKSACVTSRLQGDWDGVCPLTTSSPAECKTTDNQYVIKGTTPPLTSATWVQYSSSAGCNNIVDGIRFSRIKMSGTEPFTIPAVLKWPEQNHSLFPLFWNAPLNRIATAV